MSCKKHNSSNQFTETNQKTKSPFLIHIINNLEKKQKPQEFKF